MLLSHILISRLIILSKVLEIECPCHIVQVPGATEIKVFPVFTLNLVQLIFVLSALLYLRVEICSSELLL